MGTVAAAGARTRRRRRQPCRGPGCPRRLQADDPVVAVAAARRQRQGRAPSRRLRAERHLLAGADPLAPPVHRLAQRGGHLGPVADLARIQQPGLDQRVQVVVVEPDGNELLRLLDGKNAAAKRLGEGEGGRTAAGGAPVDGELRLLAARQRDVEPADLAAQGGELRAHPRQEVLGKRARCRMGALSLRAERTGILRQDRLLVHQHCAVCCRGVVANQDIQCPGQPRQESLGPGPDRLWSSLAAGRRRRAANCCLGSGERGGNT